MFILNYILTITLVVVVFFKLLDFQLAARCHAIKQYKVRLYVISSLNQRKNKSHTIVCKGLGIRERLLGNALIVRKKEASYVIKSKRTNSRYTFNELLTQL